MLKVFELVKHDLISSK